MRTLRSPSAWSASPRGEFAVREPSLRQWPHSKGTTIHELDCVRALPMQASWPCRQSFARRQARRTNKAPMHQPTGAISDETAPNAMPIGHRLPAPLLDTKNT